MERPNLWKEQKLCSEKDPILYLTHTISEGTLKKMKITLRNQKCGWEIGAKEDIFHLIQFIV